MKTKRRTLIVLLVFVLAAGAALALLTHANQKAEQAASEAEDGSIPLLDGTTATLESVSIQYGGETLTLRPSDDGWTLTEDPAYHLDDSACNTIRTALAGMKARRQLEAQPGEDYGSHGTILPKTRKPLEELLLPKEKFEEMGNSYYAHCERKARERALQAQAEQQT